MRPLVILRPEPGASATAKAAEDLGLRAVVIPLFAIEPVGWTAPDAAGFDALLLTSANAVRQAGAELEKVRGLSVYAVGEATAAEALRAGFSIASIGTGGVDDLLERTGADLRFLHLCGEHRRDPAAGGQEIVHLPVYRTAELAFVEGFERIDGTVAAVHSPRAAARLAEIASSAGIDLARIAIAAISAEAARSAGAGWERVEVAAEPSDAALLALAARLCDKQA